MFVTGTFFSLVYFAAMTGVLTITAAGVNDYIPYATTSHVWVFEHDAYTEREKFHKGLGCTWPRIVASCKLSRSKCSPPTPYPPCTRK